MLIVFVALLVAGIYLEKLDGREAAIWAFLTAGAGWILFRRQGMLGMNIGVGVVSIVMALRIFGGAVVSQPRD